MQSESNELQRAVGEREETVIEMVGYSFQGQARWITLIAWIKSIFFVASARKNCTAESAAATPCGRRLREPV